MPQPAITITAPSGSTAIPCTATGTAYPSTGARLVGVAYQINLGPIRPVASFTPTGGTWSHTLTAFDCPTIGLNYLLTVYAGQDTGDIGSTSVNFTRSS